MRTIKHQDSCLEVVIARLMIGSLSVYTTKIEDFFAPACCQFDASLVAYVLSWQSRHGLTPDGVIGPATWAAIAKAAPTVSTSKNSRSNAALAVQLLIGGNLTADAIYGPRTKAAVVAWQTAKGLKADGIVGPKTWAALLTGEAEAMPGGTYTQPVDYKQGDSRWGSKMYSNHGAKSQTMSNSGCGPTAMADVVAALIDSTVTPWTLAQLAMEWGDRTYDNGTSWSFFQHVQAHYHFPQMIQTASLDGLKACLDAGGYVVCSMGPGYWTKSGHFITAWMYDGSYIYCNDPASSTRKKQSISDFLKQRKQFFCFYPKVDISTMETPTTGDKIIDISKWQGDIDFDRVQSQVALVIARAGVGSDPDPRFDAYARDMLALGIPFGVYGYSYAATEAKARDEAQKLIQRASSYEPLFYVLDAEEAKITPEAIRAWADEMRKAGKRIGCYVAHNLYKDYGFADLRGLFDFVWIPRYGKNDGTIEHSTKPAYACDLWQYTSMGQVDGVTGRVDLNTITGKSLDWFLGVGE